MLVESWLSVILSLQGRPGVPAARPGPADEERGGPGGAQL